MLEILATALEEFEKDLIYIHSDDLKLIEYFFY